MPPESFHRLVDPAEVLPFLRGRPKLAAVLERVLGLREVNRVIRESCQESVTPDEFSGTLLSKLGIRYVVNGDQNGCPIPRDGGTLIIANHPFGGADAVALLHFCLACRPDTKVFGNRILDSIPPLRPCLLSLEIMSGNASISNGMSLRKAIQHLRKGGLAILFPAGAVSRFHLGSMAVHDAVWPDELGGIVRLARAGVLPIGICGRNSLLFHLLGLAHPDVRTALLPREFVRLKGRTLQLAAGDLIPWERLKEKTDREISLFLRKRVDSLQL